MRVAFLRRAALLAMSIVAVGVPSGCVSSSSWRSSVSAPGQARTEPPAERVRAQPVKAQGERASGVDAQESGDLEPLGARYASVPALARFRGEVSYYSDALAGRPTASGERYEPKAMTAAHRSLPFGTVVRVLREDTGGVATVRINDRGPFVRGRVLDVSRAAAEALDLIRRGVAPVRVEVVAYGVERKRSARQRKKRP